MHRWRYAFNLHEYQVAGVSGVGCFSSGSISLPFTAGDLAFALSSKGRNAVAGQDENRPYRFRLQVRYSDIGEALQSSHADDCVDSEADRLDREAKGTPLNSARAEAGSQSA